MALKATPNTDWVYPPKTAYQSREWDVRVGMARVAPYTRSKGDEEINAYELPASLPRRLA